MKLFKSLSFVLIQATKISGTIWAHSSCSGLKVEDAVNAALNWAHTASNALNLNPPNPDVRALSLLLFKTQDQIDKAKERIDAVVAYGPFDRGEPTKDNLVLGHNAAIYCDVSTWKKIDEDTYQHEHSQYDIDKKGYEDGLWKECMKGGQVLAERRRADMAITYSGENGFGPQYGDTIMICKDFQERFKKHPVLSQTDIDNFKSPASSRQWKDKIKGAIGVATTPVDRMASFLDHTLLHELFHGQAALKADDVGDKPYGWKNIVFNMLDDYRYLNADTLAYFCMVASLIMNDRATVNAAGDVVVIP